MLHLIEFNECVAGDKISRFDALRARFNLKVGKETVARQLNVF